MLCCEGLREIDIYMIFHYDVSRMLSRDTKEILAKVAQRNKCSYLSLLLTLAHNANRDAKKGMPVEESIENNLKFMQRCVICTA